MDGDNKQVDLIYGAAIDKISRARIKCPRIFLSGGIQYSIRPDENSGG